ncbi:branched-chain amino acid ABC transporter permease [Desulfatitalea alkaliphila]|uniref:Branched-chain amino acid ABC transporter permease n=1 Tax=Desulfatitalea alkaliphila TaxID=2929485 RepID=A0AA41UIS4_9BACT|nr:branched-chain amino acid ABC transporter permease [Desulfatitalea alkaliphila]MCJ8500414.1 branched-chain amino acid ABC transporter permease [Desulfatitalea alkaliphila]
MIFDIVITSLIKGSTYAMLAIGFSLIFGVARIVNIAHTAFYMVAAYCIFYTTTQLGFNPILAIFVAVILVSLLGLITFKLLIAPIREHEAAVLIATIALAIALQEVMMILFTGDYRSVPPLVPGFATIMGVKVFYQQLLTFVSVLVVLGLMYLFLQYTRLGLAIRATAQDREVANLMGMNESQVAMLAMGISVGLAGVTGAVLAPLSIVEPHMWNHPLAMMLAVVVLGGLGSIKGSLYAAFILGTAEALVVFMIPAGAYLKGAVALSIMVFVLLVRPAGLFGVQFEEER